MTLEKTINGMMVNDTGLLKEIESLKKDLKNWDRFKENVNEWFGSIFTIAFVIDFIFAIVLFNLVTKDKNDLIIKNITITLFSFIIFSFIIGLLWLIFFGVAKKICDIKNDVIEQVMDSDEFQIAKAYSIIKKIGDENSK